MPEDLTRTYHSFGHNVWRLLELMKINGAAEHTIFSKALTVWNYISEPFYCNCTCKAFVHYWFNSCSNSSRSISNCSSDCSTEDIHQSEDYGVQVPLWILPPFEHFLPWLKKTKVWMTISVAGLTCEGKCVMHGNLIILSHGKLVVCNLLESLLSFNRILTTCFHWPPLTTVNR